ncbi:MAG: hypothetical protein QXK12_02440 [Candidatus Nezhaarchaeales archaeon]
MGGRKRRRKIIKRLPKRIPSVFTCPNCDSKSVTVEIDRKQEKAIVKCGNCGIWAEVPSPPIYEEVHAFNKFVDLYYANKVVAPKA